MSVSYTVSLSVCLIGVCRSPPHTCLAVSSSGTSLRNAHTCGGTDGMAWFCSSRVGSPSEPSTAHALLASSPVLVYWPCATGHCSWSGCGTFKCKQASKQASADEAKARAAGQHILMDPLSPLLVCVCLALPPSNVYVACRTRTAEYARLHVECGAVDSAVASIAHTRRTAVSHRETGHQMKKPGNYSKGNACANSCCGE